MPKYDSLWFADAHQKRRADEQFALKQVVDAAIKHKVKCVIGAGDLLDRQTNRAETVGYFFKQLDRLEEADIGFDYLQGQHDWDEPSWMSGHRLSCHIHQATFEMGPYAGYGLDFQPFGTLQEKLAEIPEDCNLLVAHQGWGAWMGEEKSPQGDFAQVPGHITHVVTGDLHHWKLEKHKNADGVKMLTLSPGALCMQKINEPADHFYALMTEAGIFEQKPLQSRVFIDWSALMRTEDLDKFMSEIEGELAAAQQTAASKDYPEEMLRPYLRVTYLHTLTDAVRRIEKAVAGRALLYWKELPPEDKAPAKDRPKVVKGAAVTPLMVLPKKVDKDKQPEVFDLTTRLLTAQEHKEAFQNWWTETLGEKE